MAADIYSAGVVLYTMRTKFFPHSEDSKINGYDLAQYLHEGDSSKFWDAQYAINGDKDSFSLLSEEFKELFWSMTRGNPKERASLEEIKESSWYNGPVYGAEELAIKVQRFFTQDEEMNLEA
jgi:Protein kinase domain.